MIGEETSKPVVPAVQPQPSAPALLPAARPKRLLFVTFDFPPCRTSAVYRHVGLLKYLQKFGWQPSVLTVRDRRPEAQDRSLLERFPREIPIERTDYLSLTAWETPVGKGIRDLGGLEPVSPRRPQKWFDRKIRAGGAFIRSCLYYPDETAGWVPWGLRRALRMHRERPFDLVYTSSPPRSAPLIGWWMKRLTGIPWVTEFRDPWYPPQRPLRRMFERWLQTSLLRQASALVLISQGFAQELQLRYGVPAQKLFVVPNGFDEEDFAALPTPADHFFPPGYIHLAHFGIVYPKFSGSFFPALAELVREQPQLRERLRVHIIGFPDEDCARSAQEEPLQGIVQIHEFMEHSQALVAMLQSDVLLLFLGDSQVSRLSGLGKIYWYLRCRRPILAIAPEGGARDLLLESQAGWVVPPHDRAQIKEALRQMLHAPTAGSRSATPDFVARFRYDTLAGRLAEVLNVVQARG